MNVTSYSACLHVSSLVFVFQTAIISYLIVAIDLYIRRGKIRGKPRFRDSDYKRFNIFNVFYNNIALTP